MRKLILTTSFLIALFISGNLLAQVHVGVKGSFDLVKMNLKVEGKKVENPESYKFKPAFNAGIFAEFSIADEFYFRPELLFSSKGIIYHKVQDLSLDTKAEYTDKTTLNYLELPVYFVYKHDLSSGNIMLGVGPYFAYGLNGKVKQETVITRSSANPQTTLSTRETLVEFENNLEFDNDYDLNRFLFQYVGLPMSRKHFKRFDVGASIMAGYEFSSKLSALVVAQFGLTDITPKANGNKINSNTKHIGFGISLGYRIF
ncbi:MAG: porin family protein [Bacteroidales bacterium]|jgi:hypothetical protein